MVRNETEGSLKRVGMSLKMLVTPTTAKTNSVLMVKKTQIHFDNRANNVSNKVFTSPNLN